MQVGPDVFGVGAEGEGVEVEVGGVVVLALEGVRDAQVHPHAHVVRPDVQGAVVELDGLVRPAEVGQRCADLVHEQVVGGVEVEGAVEEINGDLVLALDEEEDGECGEQFGVVGVDLGGLVEDLDELVVHHLDFLDLVGGQVDHFLWDDAGDALHLVLGVEHQPALEEVHGLDLVEHVGAGDAEAEQAVEVVGAVLEAVGEAGNRLLVLVVLLQDPSQDAPGLAVLQVLLEVRLKRQHRLVVVARVDQLEG